MATQIQLRQGTTTEHNSFTGAVGEVTVDTTKKTLVVHDGVTAGGFPVVREVDLNNQVFGIGQTWQNMTASRVVGTTYTNTTGRPIQVSIKIHVASYQSSDLYVGSELVSGIVADVVSGGSITGTMQATVLSGQTYRITSASLGFKWSELR